MIVKDADGQAIVFKRGQVYVIGRSRFEEGNPG
jgi:hypothetical protein